MAAALLEAHERSRNDYVTAVEAARSEAEAANRAKDEFLAMLGHELRNPLAPVLTALQLMRMRGDTSSMRERDVIDRQVRHLARLVDDLLDVSRLRGGKVQLRRGRFELYAAVQRAVEIASPLITERRHYLLTEVPATGLPIDGDELRIAQVLSNLLTNAAKYTDPGGRISLVARAENGMAVIDCIDDGTSITPELKPRLFNLFAQGERAIDRGLGGLGLGLAVAKSLAELHGGTIEAHSDGPGKGSRFTVHLPLATGTAAAPEQPASPALDAGAPRIARRVLVVDDNRDALDMLANVLKVAGFTLQSAATGEAALELAPAFKPDVAVLDIGLPGINGFDLARALRADYPDIRLVAVTGYGQDGDIAAAYEAGFDLHLAKPASMETLIEFIRQA
jgi:CheY-like chemotaxis protein